LDKEPVFLKPDEAARLFRAAKQEDPAEFWMFMLTTGARIGESTGIRWADIDFNSNTVTIRGQLQRIDGKLRYRATTRTNQIRVLPLSLELVKQLPVLQALDHQYGSADPDGIVFLNPDGRRLDPKYMRNKLARLCHSHCSHFSPR